MSFLKNLFKKFSKQEEPSVSIEEATDIVSTPSEVIDLDKDEQLLNPVDEDYLENLEEELIKSDLGVSLALDFVDLVREKASMQEIKQSEVPAMLKDFLLSAFVFVKDNHEEGEDIQSGLAHKFELNLNQDGPSIFLVVGVNGVGKTTSIAKLAHKFKNEGKKVLIAAGDTFRAAAEDQLRIWSERVGVDIFELDSGAKPSAVVYKSIEKVKEEGYDILIIDTAGRLQNKKNLMQELAKIKEVIDKNADEGSLSETMLVLDATTGQNALSQTKTFMEICDLSSIILTKFDGTAKAGMVFSIAHNFKLPVKLVGTGEGMEDLQDFEPEVFVKKYL